MPNPTPTAPPHPRWATRRQAADHIHVHPETIDSWAEQNLITPYRFGPRLIRYDLNEIDAMPTPTTTAAEAGQ
ncbi:helix-turn-helix transcriptional regulator [Mycolicibacterium sp.]|uniref:helix-turn-helix transcriptional regulator n=1 Tax=Mycolicibacterium sp. TaxID=2320850 RepID=UPI00355FC88D